MLYTTKYRLILWFWFALSWFHTAFYFSSSNHHLWLFFFCQVFSKWMFSHLITSNEWQVQRSSNITLPINWKKEMYVWLRKLSTHLRNLIVHIQSISWRLWLRLCYFSSYFILFMVNQLKYIDTVRIFYWNLFQ